MSFRRSHPQKNTKSYRRKTKPQPRGLPILQQVQPKSQPLPHEAPPNAIVLCDRLFHSEGEFLRPRRITWPSEPRLTIPRPDLSEHTRGTKDDLIPTLKMSEYTQRVADDCGYLLFDCHDMGRAEWSAEGLVTTFRTIPWDEIGSINLEMDTPTGSNTMRFKLKNHIAMRALSTPEDFYKSRESLPQSAASQDPIETKELERSMMETSLRYCFDCHDMGQAEWSAEGLVTTGRIVLWDEISTIRLQTDTPTGRSTIQFKLKNHLKMSALCTPEDFHKSEASLALALCGINPVTIQS